MKLDYELQQLLVLVVEEVVDPFSNKPKKMIGRRKRKTQISFYWFSKKLNIYFNIFLDQITTFPIVSPVAISVK